MTGSTSSYTEPSFTTATINYFIPPTDGSRPYTLVNSDPSTGVRQRNWGSTAREVQIENLRGHEGDASLDLTGFQYFKHAAKHTSFKDDDEIKKEYYPESAELIKKLTGAQRVEFFDHTIRRRNPGQADSDPTRRQPVSNAHVDQTPAAARARVHRHLPEADVSALLTKRYQIINLWRPISHVALDWPLALCDFRSIDYKPGGDLVPTALVYPDREGETFGVKFNEGQKWKYFKGLQPDEGVLIKCFDSIQDGSVAALTPHTAFQDPTTPEGVPPRESIELRGLVFYE